MRKGTTLEENSGFTVQANKFNKYYLLHIDLIFLKNKSLNRKGTKNTPYGS